MAEEFRPTPEMLLHPQRHHPLHRLSSVRDEGRLVRAWWFVQYHQYVHGTLFGYRMLRRERRKKFDTGILKDLSEKYVFTCISVCAVLSVLQMLMRSSTVVFVAVLVVASLRLYEVVFAQVYYLLQTRRTTVSSFTRTFLFHFIFLVEGMLYASAIAVHTLDTSVPRSIGFAFLAVTLQANFLDPTVATSDIAQAAYLGCNLLGIVIFLASLPVLVGFVGKTWSQATSV